MSLVRENQVEANGISIFGETNILGTDLFGSVKPNKDNFVRQKEVYKAIDLTVPASHLKGYKEKETYCVFT